MIIPAPVNFWEYRRYPLTWGLIFINFFIYIVFFLQGTDSSSWSGFFSNENLDLTGRVYQDYARKLPEPEKKNLPQWVLKDSSENWQKYDSLATWALRDRKFLESAETLQIDGDVVAVRTWREKIHNFKNSYFEQMAFKLGLSEMNQKSLSWVTYQFSHSSFLHLFSNMIYFLIIGTAVESMIGSVGLVVLYLFGGFFAGLIFLLAKTHGGAVPMIGASGSISALMAFYVLFEERRRIRYTYFVSFHQKHYGFIYLPTLWILPFFVISDFSSYLSSVEGMGAGVAYSAHIGGTLFGCGVALIARYLLKLGNGLLWDELFPPVDPPQAKTPESFFDDEF